MTADLLERTRFTVVSLLKEAKVCELVGHHPHPSGRRFHPDADGRQDVGRNGVGQSAGPEACRRTRRSPTARRSTPGCCCKNDDFRRMSVRNVNSHDMGVLGVEPQTGRPRKKVMIAPIRPAPVQVEPVQNPPRPGQKSVAVKVIEGGDASGNDSTPIGTCVVRDLPPGLPREPMSMSHSRTPRTGGCWSTLACLTSGKRLRWRSNATQVLPRMG